MTELHEYTCAHCGLVRQSRSATTKFCSLGCSQTSQAEAKKAERTAKPDETHVPPWLRKTYPRPPGTWGTA
jgi:hypothetical protein